MSQIDTEGNVLLGTKAERDESTKLVPISESIRYRKRAQSAEKLSESLTEQLGQARDENEQITEQLEQVRLENDLMQRVIAAGAVDVEAAMLLRLKLSTLYRHVSEGKYSSAVKRGKPLRFWRDRLVQEFML